jgi:periplasmic divalent cation tolerance protein
MNPMMIYITAKNAEEAEAIGAALVEERLVACANIIHPVLSIYRWKGAIERESEAIIIAKTKESLVSAVIERVIALHSYECPCIEAIPIVKGNPAYLQWIADETAAG